MVIFANDDVNFPISNTALLVDNFRPLINTDGIFDLPSTIFSATPLSVWFSSTSQILV